MFSLRIVQLIVLILGILLTACQQKPDISNAQNFGGEVTIDEAITLTEVYANPDKYHGKEIRIDGKIREVCQRKGCWIKLSDGKNELTVRFKDYGFFVPKDAAASKVTVQGIFQAEPDMHAESEAHAQMEAKMAAEDETHDKELEGTEHEDAEESAPYSFIANAVIIYAPTSTEEL